MYPMNLNQLSRLVENELYPITRGETRRLSNAHDVTTVVLVSLFLGLFCFCF